MRVLCCEAINENKFKTNSKQVLKIGQKNYKNLEINYKMFEKLPLNALLLEDGE